jgi:hypothetical protein
VIINNNNNSVLFKNVFSFWDYEALVIEEHMITENWSIETHGKTGVLEENPVLVPLFLPNNPHGLVWNRI